MAMMSSSHFNFIDQGITSSTRCDVAEGTGNSIQDDILRQTDGIVYQTSLVWLVKISVATIENYFTDLPLTENGKRRAGYPSGKVFTLGTGTVVIRWATDHTEWNVEMARHATCAVGIGEHIVLMASTSTVDRILVRVGIWINSTFNKPMVGYGTISGAVKLFEIIVLMKGDISLYLI